MSYWKARSVPAFRFFIYLFFRRTTLDIRSAWRGALGFTVGFRSLECVSRVDPSALWRWHSLRHWEQDDSRRHRI